MGISIPAQRTAPQRHAGDEIDALPDHRARARYCYRKAASYRNKYYRRQAEVIVHAMSDPTLRSMDPIARKVTGERRWGGSKEASDLVGLEQMWSRWAVLEATMAQMDRVL